jgi:hypothetical protein
VFRFRSMGLVTAVLCAAGGASAMERIKEQVIPNFAPTDRTGWVLDRKFGVDDCQRRRQATNLSGCHREPHRQPYWREVTCAENNNHVEIGKQNYMLSPDGHLMPTRKDQPPPDLRYFNRSGKQGP